MTEFIIQYRPARAEMPDDPTPEETRIVREHFLYVKALYEAGTARYVGRTMTPPHLGLVVLEAESEQAARAAMDADPAVSNGVMYATVQEFKVVFHEKPS